MRWLSIGGERVSPYIWGREPNPEWGHMNRERWKLPQTLQQLQERASHELKEILVRTDEGDYWAEVDADEIGAAKDALDRLDFQKRMETEALDISMLSEALSRLPKLVTLNFEYTQSPPGSWELAEMGFEVHDPGIPWHCHVFQIFLQALARAECKPQRISWQNEAVQHGLEGLPIWAFNDLNWLIDQEQMSRLLSNLRVLHLEKTWHGAALKEFAFDSLLPDCALGNFLELCPQLEELYLSFGEYYRGSTNRNLMGGKAHKNLRKLTFKCLIIDLAELVNCLIRNEILEAVTLGDISLTSSDWPTFLDDLRRTPLRRLRYLRVYYLITSINPGADDWGWDGDRQNLLDYIHGKTQTNPFRQLIDRDLSLDWSSSDTELSEDLSLF